MPSDSSDTEKDEKDGEDNKDVDGAKELLEDDVDDTTADGHDSEKNISSTKEQPQHRININESRMVDDNIQKNGTFASQGDGRPVSKNMEDLGVEQKDHDEKINYKQRRQNTHSTDSTETINNTTASIPRINDSSIDANEEEDISDDETSTEEESVTDDDSDGDEEDIMPMFKYTRLFGSFPRLPRQNSNDHVFSIGSTCSKMGKVVLESSDASIIGMPSVAPPTPQQQPSRHQHQQDGGPTGESRGIRNSVPSENLQRYHNVMAIGYDNGTIQLLDMHGYNIVNPNQLLFASSFTSTVHQQQQKSSIVDLSFDSSSNFLAAINSSGMSTIFEIKYSSAVAINRTTPAVTSTRTSAEQYGDYLGLPRISQVQPEDEDPRAEQVTANHQPKQDDVFGGFLNMATNAFTRVGSGDGSSSPRRTPPSVTSGLHGPSQADESQQLLSSILRASTPVTSSKVPYPSSFGMPSVIIIDPAYKRKREKSIVVGFTKTNKLILTKRGYVFQRRVDTVIYQGPTNLTAANGKSDDRFNGGGGIECITWRGNYLSWADITGIKLFDIETMTRIAHVDRPLGARLSLYKPYITDLKPTLVFETANQLLCCWGDCVLSLSLTEQQQQQQQETGNASAHASSSSPPNHESEGTENTNSNIGTETRAGRSSNDSATATGTDNSGLPSGSNNNSVKKKRKVRVECTMAWELDCVACGVVPLDKDYLIVLGLVIPDCPDDMNDENDPQDDGDNLCSQLVMHVISRSYGRVIYSDALPLLRNPKHYTSGFVGESASSFMLLSSYALPRMDDTAEAEEDLGIIYGDFYNGDDETDGFPGGVSGVGNMAEDILSASIFSELQPKQHKFKDLHMKWSLTQLEYDCYCSIGIGPGGVDSDSRTGNKRDHQKKPGNDAKNTNPFDEDLVQEGNRYTKNDSDGVDNESDADSDDYDFFSHQNAFVAASSRNGRRALPPVMIIVSKSDTVLAQTREIDDAISHALSAGKNALALKRGLEYKRELRHHSLNNLINHYLSALLRLPRLPEHSKATTHVKMQNEVLSPIPSSELGNGVGHSLSLRRVRLAAKTTPLLLGGNILLWEKWISIFADIPGALFVLKDYIPVRDPVLPPKLYERILEKMLIDVESLISSDLKSDKESFELYHSAKGHFLSTVCAWGPTSALRERIKFYKYEYDQSMQQIRWQNKTDSPNPQLEIAEKSLHQRMHQSAVGFLEFPLTEAQTLPHAYSTEYGGIPVGDGAVSYDDSLFDIDMLLSGFSSLVPLIQSPEERMGSEDISPDKTNSQVALQVVAELYLMKGMDEIGLKCFLMIGSLHGGKSLTSIEDEAINNINSLVDPGAQNKTNPHNPYSFVIAMIECHHLHRCLLQDNFLSSDRSSDLSPPLISLIRLVGLDEVGEFLMEHSVSPVVAADNPFSSESGRYSTLPVNLVADQLRTRPKLLHWYLHHTFKRRPDIYVKFPHTTILPLEIQNLHRTHLDLYVRFAGENKDSVDFLSRAAETLKTKPATTEEPITPLNAFLIAILPLGGARPEDVRKLLEEKRAGKGGSLDDVISRVGESKSQEDVKYPSFFALELAYVLEHYGKKTEEEAIRILSLYLYDAKSIRLAVFYTHRSRMYSSLLWERLVGYCVNSQDTQSITDAVSVKTETGTPGVLFGSLLEAAAQSGADLARLVKDIPQGLSIEGLRPRLVAAVADYRLKLKMHETSKHILSSEKVSLLRESLHRSRRGMKFQSSLGIHKKNQTILTRTPKNCDISSTGTSGSRDAAMMPSSILANTIPRPSERQNRNQFSISLAIR